MTYLCTHCTELFSDKEILQDLHPFQPDTLIYGCPHCREACDLLAACDFPGCREGPTCGTPTREGYRRTCHRHRPHGTDPPVTPDL